MTQPQYEQVVPDQSSSFRCFHRRCRDLSTDHPWHFHPQYELSWVMQSDGVRYVGNYIKPYVPNEVVLYGPNLPHCSRNEERPGERSIVEYITLQFDIDCFGDGFLELPESRAVKELLTESRRAILFDPVASDLVGADLHSLVDLSGLPRLLKLAEVLHKLASVGRRKLTSDSYLDDVVLDRHLVHRLNKVQSYVEAHFRGVVSQSDIAAELDMTPSSFSKFVRSATGQTFMNMVQLTRINEACRLLAHSGDRITDVALECGYQHTSHFDRAFRDLKGISPTAYRQRVRALGVEASLPKVA